MLPASLCAKIMVFRRITRIIEVVLNERAVLLLCFLCESIMFPTIFSLSLRHVGTQTKQASSYLIMSIVGGAVAPLLMGLIADRISMAVGFIVPLVCFMEIWGFAARYRKLS